MCELFGFTSAHETDIREYLKIFFSHGIHHPHGWGLMRENHGSTEILKEAVSSVESNKIYGIIEETLPQKTTLAHIRLATVGSVKTENCHPYIQKDYSGRCWTLIHNGTIYSGKQLMKYLYTQTGDTDSERISFALLDEINEKQPKTAKQRFDIVDNFVVSLSKRNKLNLMIYDGELLYVHQNMLDTLHYKSENDRIVFSTKPMDNGNWKSYPMTQLYAFNAGKKVFEGIKHEHIFVPALDYITEMDAMNI
ncbi:MAG: class II glutamine amidotransferase [Ruminococcus sp.]|nr:class II glutamine amidotransferase [Ruminococcus sp.]MDE7136975.1 class II glutamine amidotransferase [Ruminococcus sp.]